MRRFALAFVALLVLVGCAPVLSPTIERVDDSVTVTVTANRPAYSVTLSVLNVTSEDERCGPIGPDIGCVLGDISEGQSVVVEATMNTERLADAAHCVAFGFSDPNLNVGSYRPYPCEVAGGSS